MSVNSVSLLQRNSSFCSWNHPLPISNPSLTAHGAQDPSLLWPVTHPDPQPRVTGEQKLTATCSHSSALCALSLRTLHSERWGQAVAVSPTSAVCSFPCAKARSWEGLGEARPGRAASRQGLCPIAPGRRSAAPPVWKLTRSFPIQACKDPPAA